MPRPPLGFDRLEPRALPAAPFNTLPILPAATPGVADAAHAILARGATLGRNPGVFMKVGDSNSDPGYGAGYLFPFGNPGYNAAGLAAAYPELLDTLAVYRTPAGITGANSFGRASSVAVSGARAPGVLPGLLGEAAATGAGVALVMIGTNDVYVGRGAEAYRTDLREIVRTLSAAGVVPVLSTIPDNLAFGGSLTAAVPAYNQVIADVADESQLPLWNLWRAFTTLPNRGLGSDGLHLSVSQNPGGVSAGDLAFGQNLRSLEALQILDWFREQVVAAPPPAAAPLPWTPLAAGASVFATGRGEGQAPVVSVCDATGREVNRFLAFDPAFTGGVRVATADVTGDDIPDIVVGAGLGGAPVVKVFSGADGAQVMSVFAFEPSFRSGVHVAAADLDGDGVAEVVAGAGDGGGPVVAVYRGGDFAAAGRFFAYEPSFRGGVHVAAGDVAGIGQAIVTGAGTGGGPVVKVFRLGDPTPALSYLAYDVNVRTGVTVAVADIDGGGGDVATAPAAGAPHVIVANLKSGAVRGSFFAPTTGTAGVSLGTLHGTDGTDALLIGNGPGSAARTWAYHGLSADPFGPADPLRAYGLFVG